MSAGVFPPTSSRSTRRRTSTRAPEFAGYSGLHEGVSQRIGPGISVTAAGPADRTVGPDGRPDRPGANGAFACPGEFAFSLSSALALPELRLSLSRACSCLSPGPPCLPTSPPPSFPLAHPVSPPSPPRLSPGPPWVRVLPSSARQLSLALPCAVARSRRVLPRRRKNTRSLAAYLARYGEHGSHLRGLMRVNDPCPGNVLI